MPPLLSAEPPALNDFLGRLANTGPETPAIVEMVEGTLARMRKSFQSFKQGTIASNTSGSTGVVAF